MKMPGRKNPHAGISMAEATENMAINLGRKTPDPDEFPAFSGDEPTCPACGEQSATTTFMGYGQCEHAAKVVIGYWSNPRLHRACSRCGYAWDEATVT